MRVCSEHGDNSNVCDTQGCFPPFPPLKPRTPEHSEIYFEMACVAEKQNRFMLAELYLRRALSRLR